MEGDSRLKLFIAGLILAAFAIGYFIIAGRFQGQKVVIPKSSPSAVVENSPTPSPIPSASPSGLESLPETTKGG